MSHSADPATRHAGRASAPLFAALLGAALLLSYAPRLEQYLESQQHPAGYFVGGVPTASTDSYYWFRLAREHLEGGVEVGAVDPLRHHPDGKVFGPVPAISRLIAGVARVEGIDVYRAGLQLGLLLSSLFLLPLGVLCFCLGSPLAGLLGGLIGTFSFAYMARSSVWRVDTDGGNQLFVWLVACLMVLQSPSRSRRANLIYAALGGAALNAFCWWYGQLGFWLLFQAAFVLYLVCAGFARRDALLLLLTFVLFSNPLRLTGAADNALYAVSNYIFSAPSIEAGGAEAALRFPSVLAEIQELKGLPPERVLAGAIRSPLLSGVGLLGFALFGLVHWRRAAPLLPVAFLAALALLRSRRYTMYLAPLVGIGWGYLLTLLVDAVGGWAGAWRARSGGLRREIALYGVGAAAFLSLVSMGGTAYSWRPRPAVRPELIASLLELREQLPADSALWHSWSRGYLIADVTGFATFNDGQAPDPVIEQLTSRAVASPDPVELRAILGFLARHGRRGVDRLLEEGIGYADLLERMAAEHEPVPANLFLLFSHVMPKEFIQYRYKGYWDFEQLRGPREGYAIQDCELSQDLRLHCRRDDPPIVIDTESGRVDGQPRVKKLLWVRRGRVERELDFVADTNVYLQLIDCEPGSSCRVQLIREAVFRSNFNQMYVLGRFDPALFEATYDAFPTARVYRVRTSPGDG